jgi:PAS domain S-box-containing protein
MESTHNSASRFHRERNREHAKRSRIRKKFLLESLQQSVTLLKEENDKLRGSIRTHLGDDQANELLKKESLAHAAASANSLIATNSKDANKVLDDPDFSFIKALQTAQQNFVVTDPSLPDNPIVYATQGFLVLTGYTLDQVLGRNCRFLQGPETDPKAVEKIRGSIDEGTDMSVCLLNYRVDGTTFWNQFFIAALRDAAGNITNYVGVQCKVSDQYAANVCKKQEEEFAKMEEDLGIAGNNDGAAGGEVEAFGQHSMDNVGPTASEC